jgi:hypothetical protein
VDASECERRVGRSQLEAHRVNVAPILSIDRSHSR